MPEGWCPRRDPALAISRLWAERLTGLHRQVTEAVAEAGRGVVEGLTDRVSVIAAATPELAARIAEMLDNERRAPPG
jgi:hypothetical protein